MATDSESFFADHFASLTGRQPYPWQRKLFLDFVAPSSEPWPEVVDLPTGAGKTTVLYIWLLALAWSIRNQARGVPRRLAWIVNRRVVVDQVTTEVEQLLKALERCPDLVELLSSMSATNAPLKVSTLRGEHADNGDWSRDPSTPAVVVGTVDMIGSRLLFRAYRAGPYFRPIHAGLLGVDTLIVNDEAHLSPAMAHLLGEVRDGCPAAKIPGKSFRILLLSATQNSRQGLQRFDHDPAQDVAESRAFEKIFHAPKSLTLREVANLNELDAAVWSLATEAPASRTAVFIEQPEKAAKLAERLRKDNRPCALLTGTMRGLERDALLTDNEVFKHFLQPEPDGEPVWLVCTSAGEVGINFSCERMITGLAEADHLLQRFGRLNRFGSSVPGEAYVVFRKPGDKNALQHSLVYLRQLDGDVSCSKIWHNRPPAEACTDLPVIPRLESRHVDIWAQTTFPDRVVPPVASWLHGQQEAEAPQSQVAWRSDVELLTRWQVGADQLRKVLDYYPVQTQETLSEPSNRVHAKLQEIAARLGPAAASETKLILVESDGSPSIWDLLYVAEQAENFLAYKLVLLPETVGSVKLGMFNSAAKDEAETLDAADRMAEELHPARIRFHFAGASSCQRLPSLMTEAVDMTPPESSERPDLVTFAAERYKPALTIQRPDADEEVESLAYFGERSQLKSGKQEDVRLSDHQSAVARQAKEMANRVGLAELLDLYEDAGKLHDQGKRREVWQRAMGGTMEAPLAKTKAPVNLRLIDGYRHELGSVLDAIADGCGQDDDLLLHLIASHHAAARPFFRTQQYDCKNLRESARESAEIARRFARLQERFGAWGLAYLEAVFKCADGLISSGKEGDAASA